MDSLRRVAGSSLHQVDRILNPFPETSASPAIPPVQVGRAEWVGDARVSVAGTRLTLWALRPDEPQRTREIPYNRMNWSVRETLWIGGASIRT